MCSIRRVSAAPLRPLASRDPNASAPPPKIADSKAVNRERLLSDPTTSSGKGMASVGCVMATRAAHASKRVAVRR